MVLVCVFVGVFVDAFVGVFVGVFVLGFVGLVANRGQRGQLAIHDPSKNRMRDIFGRAYSMVMFCVFVGVFVGVFVNVFVGVFVGGFVCLVGNRGQLYTSLPKIARETIFGRV